MKKKLLLIIWLAFAANLLIAQETGSSGGLLDKFDFGVKFGMNSSRLVVDNNYFTAPKVGFNGGIFIEYKVIDLLSVSFEPMFLQQGANRINPQIFYSESSPILLGLERTDVKLNSISLPVFANAVLPMDAFQPKFFGGLSFDFYKWAYTINKHTLPENSIEKTRVTQDDITPRVQKMGISGVIGAGIVKKMDPLVLSVDLRYMYGLQKLSNVANYPQIKNSTFALTLGIGF